MTVGMWKRDWNARPFDVIQRVAGIKYSPMNIVSQSSGL